MRAPARAGALHDHAIRFVLLTAGVIAASVFALRASTATVESANGGTRPRLTVDEATLNRVLGTGGVAAVLVVALAGIGASLMLWRREHPLAWVPQTTAIVLIVGVGSAVLLIAQR